MIVRSFSVCGPFLLSVDVDFLMAHLFIGAFGTVGEGREGGGCDCECRFGLRAAEMAWRLDSRTNGKTPTHRPS